jgi:hypothetical protein
MTGNSEAFIVISFKLNFAQAFWSCLKYRILQNAHGLVEISYKLNLFKSWYK